MLYVSLAFSAALAAVVNGIALSRRKEGVGRACLCSLVAVAIFGCMGTMPLALNGLLVPLAGGVC